MRLPSKLSVALWPGNLFSLTSRGPGEILKILFIFLAHPLLHLLVGLRWLVFAGLLLRLLQLNLLFLRINAQPFISCFPGSLSALFPCFIKALGDMR